MNKRKQIIINKRVKLIKRLASQMKPFANKQKEDKFFKPLCDEWYTKNLVTPLRAASIIKNMKPSDCLRLYYRINEIMSYQTDNLYGNYFVEKFTMCIFACKNTQMREDLEASYLEHTAKPYPG